MQNEPLCQSRCRLGGGRHALAALQTILVHAPAPAGLSNCARAILQRGLAQRRPVRRQLGHCRRHPRVVLRALRAKAFPEAEGILRAFRLRRALGEAGRHDRLILHQRRGHLAEAPPTAEVVVVRLDVYVHAEIRQEPFLGRHLAGVHADGGAIRLLQKAASLGLHGLGYAHALGQEEEHPANVLGNRHIHPVVALHRPHQPGEEEVEDQEEGRVREPRRPVGLDELFPERRDPTNAQRGQDVLEDTAGPRLKFDRRALHVIDLPHELNQAFVPGLLAVAPRGLRQ
mmetsp:Transcript_161276/g.512523  ORF Transcript_161276/g.512523 Transcript_161276/m.512523 type:complete len:286 (+) Transcript_161276:33-890(+)